MSHKEWKNKVVMWKILTPVPTQKQANIILLDSLEGTVTAERAVSEQLTATDLKNVDGLNVLFQKFDKTFKSGKIDEAYSVYKNVAKFQKSRNVNSTKCFRRSWNTKKVSFIIFIRLMS